MISLFLGAIALSACSGGGGGGADGASVWRFEVGSEGGRFEVGSGGLAGFSLEAAPGAVTATVRIELRPAGTITGVGLLAIGPAVSLQPASIPVQGTLRLGLPFDPAPVVGADSAAQVVVLQRGGNGRRVLSPIAIDRAGRAVVEVASLGEFEVALVTGPERLEFVTAPAAVSAGAVVAAPIELALIDPRGGPYLEPHDVEIELVSGLPLGGRTRRSSSGGQVAFDDLYVERAGPGLRLRAVARSGAEALSDPFDVRPATPTALVFAEPVPSGVSGAALVRELEVWVVDRFGNRTAADLPSVSLILDPHPSGAVLLAPAAVRARAGVARFREPAIDRAGNGFVLRARASGLAQAVSSAFDVFNWDDGDPLFSAQWHLQNRGQTGGVVGVDVRAMAAWQAGARGEGVRVAVVDDGLEIGHEDLAPNVVPGASHDYVDGDDDPSTGDHGTLVAGIACARDFNGLGVRGVSPRAELVGFNLLASYSSVNEADALTRDVESIWVSNNSWGNPDGTGALRDAPFTWRLAIEEGLVRGRGGLGTIYVVAAGNGGSNDDVNYDGYNTHRGVICVGALDDHGAEASFSERGAALWVCAPVRARSGEAITSTDRSGDRGYNPARFRSDLTDRSYSQHMDGTSAAAPMVSGVAALVLEAAPMLGWRDVKWILAESARVTDAGDPDWVSNGAGFMVNHNYGFGMVDAKEALELARRWRSFGPERKVTSGERTPGLVIVDGDPAGVSDAVTIAGSGIGAIEWVNVEFTASDHRKPEELEVVLTNQATGTESVLARPHVCRGGCMRYDRWIFGTGRHLGEPADAEWTLRVSDRHSGGGQGSFMRWRLEIYGH